MIKRSDASFVVQFWTKPSAHAPKTPSSCFLLFCRQHLHGLHSSVCMQTWTLHCLFASALADLLAVCEGSGVTPRRSGSLLATETVRNEVSERMHAAGPVGILTAHCAVFRGAARVIVIDEHAYRLVRRPLLPPKS